MCERNADTCMSEPADMQTPAYLSLQTPTVFHLLLKSSESVKLDSEADLSCPEVTPGLCSLLPIRAHQDGIFSLWEERTVKKDQEGSF